MLEWAWGSLMKVGTCVQKPVCQVLKVRPVCRGLMVGMRLASLSVGSLLCHLRFSSGKLGTLLGVKKSPNLIENNHITGSSILACWGHSV